MSAGYTGIQWNRQKKRYDVVLVALLLLAVAGYVAVSLVLNPRLTVESLIIRGSALSAFLLLHVILSIGPLCRIDPRFLPLLYNRRHLGVATFLLALIHAALVVFQFHALGDANPLVSVFTAYAADYALFPPGTVAHFPFEPLGAVALGILFLMAATSHDFWLRNLGPSFWKSLHVLVLVAYGLLVGHVAFGVLQSEDSPAYTVLLAVGVAWVLGLHLIAAVREARGAVGRSSPAADGYVQVCRVKDLEENRGKVVRIGSERLAVFLVSGRIRALSNVCRHQGGPLGEGRIVDGCVTCPWHGWQYRPEDGCSPPPFDERVETYRVRVADSRVYVHPDADPPGTLQDEALEVGRAENPPRPAPDEFYVGYLDQAPPGLARRLSRIVAMLAIAALLIVAIVAGAQSRQPAGVFEFGVAREFEGVLYETPVPFLHIARSGDERERTAATNLLLVGSGKHGLPPFARGHHGERVAFTGSLIYRANVTMVEMNAPGSFRVLGPARPGDTLGKRELIGDVDIVGELVDTKCYLGGMRPATGKVHRACAVRCLEGGVPPGLLVRDAFGGAAVFMLVGPEGRPPSLDPQWAARAVHALGTLELHDGLPLLRLTRAELVDPDS